VDNDDHPPEGAKPPPYEPEPAADAAAQATDAALPAVGADVPATDDTDEAVDAAAATETGEEALVRDGLTRDERDERWRRLAEPGVDAALRKRYAGNVVDDVMLDDLLQATLEAALGASDFPAEGQPLFPWLYKKATARRRQLMRHHQRRAGREVALDDVDREHHAPAPDIDAIPDALQPKADLLARLTADDTGKRRAAEWTRQKVVEEVPVAAIAEMHQVSPYVVHKTMSRFKSFMRIAAGPAAAAALAGVVLFLLVPHQLVAPPVGRGPEIEPIRSAASDDSAKLWAEAAVLRDEGIRACDDEQWRVCLEKLTQAKRDDPLLADDAEVRQALLDANQAMESKSPLDMPHRKGARRDGGVRREAGESGR